MNRSRPCVTPFGARTPLSLRFEVVGVIQNAPGLKRISLKVLCDCHLRDKQVSGTLQVSSFLTCVGDCKALPVHRRR